MCAKYTPPDIQARRHEFTINLYHALPKSTEGLPLNEQNALFREAWDNWKESIRNAVGIQWLGAALELNEAGALHVNGYVCWTNQTRMLTKKGKRGAGCKKLQLPFACSVRPVRMPDNLYDYVTGCGKHAGKPAEDRLQLGEYVSSGRQVKHAMVNTAIEMTLAGLTPGQIARENPRVFFYHYRAIEALHDALKAAPEQPETVLDGSSASEDATITEDPSQVSQMEDAEDEMGDA